MKPVDKKLAIGETVETVEAGGSVFTVKRGGCLHCCFYGETCTRRKDMPECLASKRSDRRGVYFVKMDDK